MKDKLSRLIKVKPASSTPKQAPVSEETKEQEAWVRQGADILTFDEGWCARIRKRYALEDRYGTVTFAESARALKENDHPFFRYEGSLSDVYFLDTETTGLRGSGSTVFLIGYARFVDQMLEVTQYVLPHPACEEAFYYHAFSGMADGSLLVTYNGKSFDWPQIRSRHTFVRERVTLPEVEHIDLLHAARRLLKPQLKSVGLQAVEAHFGHVREGDLPGFLAPMHYFHYMKTQQPDVLLPVLGHHHDDCLSLVTLLAHFSDLVTAEQEPVIIENRANWSFDLGEHERALTEFSSLDVAAAKTRMRQAKLLRRAGRYDEANALLRGVATVEANVELAKDAEHRQKNYELALEHVHRAFELHEKKRAVLRKVSEREQAELTHRLRRLERKRL